jgi:hypothetical protein
MYLIILHDQHLGTNVIIKKLSVIYEFLQYARVFVIGKNGLFDITSHVLASLNHQTLILSVNDYFFNIGALVKKARVVSRKRQLTPS